MSGRVVFVTGSSTGIGEAAALHFARLGDTVYATMRTPDSSGDELRVAAQLEELDVTLLALDVVDDHSVARAVGAAMERSGHIDVLVNNAGIGSLTSIEEVSMEDAKAIFETNVFGWHAVIRRVLPVMRAAGEGRIVQNSSVLGLVALPYRGAYVASKFAIEALTDTMRLELRDSDGLMYLGSWSK